MTCWLWLRVPGQHMSMSTQAVRLRSSGTGESSASHSVSVSKKPTTGQPLRWCSSAPVISPSMSVLMRLLGDLRAPVPYPPDLGAVQRCPPARARRAILDVHDPVTSKLESSLNARQPVSREEHRLAGEQHLSGCALPLRRWTQGLVHKDYRGTAPSAHLTAAAAKSAHHGHPARIMRLNRFCRRRVSCCGTLKEMTCDRSTSRRQPTCTRRSGG